jgi:hypothetical protein
VVKRCSFLKLFRRSILRAQALPECGLVGPAIHAQQTPDGLVVSKEPCIAEGNAATAKNKHKPGDNDLGRNLPAFVLAGGDEAELSNPFPQGRTSFPERPL